MTATAFACQSMRSVGCSLRTVRRCFGNGRYKVISDRSIAEAAAAGRLLDLLVVEATSTLLAGSGRSHSCWRYPDVCSQIGTAASLTGGYLRPSEPGFNSMVA